jgi:hypothetical protein
MKLRIIIAGLLMAVAAFSNDTGAELFQRAVTQERAAGNLEEAITLYQRVVTQFASDRALVAKALLREAQCYEKLGQGKALTLYEQVARDYRDQSEAAAMASARLAALKQPDRTPTAITQRIVEVPGSAQFETNGQQAIYIDDETGALTAGDLARRDKRVIFKPKAGERIDDFACSRDLSMVELFVNGANGTFTTRAVIKSDGSGYREVRGDRGYSEWSWDNRYLFVSEGKPDHSGWLWLRIRVADGDAQKVESGDYFPRRVSPDGRFIAVTESLFNAGGKILVIPSQGGKPELVSDAGRLADWTPDGRYLTVLQSDGVYAIPMQDGRPTGAATLIRTGVFFKGRTYANGALGLVQSSPDGAYATWLGTLNPDGSLGSWKRLRLSGDFSGAENPTWSPDSRQIAYVGYYTAKGKNAGQMQITVRLRHLATGDEREIYQENAPNGAAGIQCIWAAHQSKLLCQHSTPQTHGLFSIGTDSGKVEQLGALPMAWEALLDVRDDSAVYVMRPQDHELVRWEIGVQRATTLERDPGLLVYDALSPDGRWIARQMGENIEIRPALGGNWKPLVKAEVYSGHFAFTPDGNWFLYYQADNKGRNSLFRVATTGGQPERIGDFPGSNWGSFSPNMLVSPDGQKVIAQTANPPQVSMLEHFEPNPSKR